MNNKIISIQTIAKPATAAPQLLESISEIIEDDKLSSIIPVANHPLMNSIPFGGSFGCFDLEDNKW